jgi:hypothetical protein
VQNDKIRTSVFDFLVLRLGLPKGSAKDDVFYFILSLLIETEIFSKMSWF